MTFARMFKFHVFADREAAYAAYLRDVVTPIDEAAHKAGAFDRLATVTPQSAGDWNHGRVFFFRDRAQRDAFAASIAQHAAVFDGSAEATAARKARAETLRKLVAIFDFEITS
ncbi:MAG TPA: hypothetical protein VHC39_09350 [Rhizomicrobium sp.]|nr:hypothetical protein [Rhizomicrobium sp.]